MEKFQAQGAFNAIAKESVKNFNAEEEESEVIL